MNPALYSEWFVPAIAAVAGLVFAMITRPKVWLSVVFLCLPFFLFDSGKNISASEVVGGGFVIGTVFAWSLNRALVKGQSIIYDWSDFLLWLFYLLSAVNVVVAKLNGVPLIGWLTDWSYFLMIAYCFPLREEFGKDPKGIRQLAILGGISSILMALFSAYQYKQRMAESMMYAYQMMTARSALLGPLFLLVISVGIVAFVLVNNRSRVFVGIVLLLNLAALGLTFTRTLWVLMFACIALIMLFLTFGQNVRLVTSGAVAAVLCAIVALWYNPRLAEIASKFVVQRFTTSTQLSGGDRSFETRLIESRAVWSRIKQAPLGGQGLRSKFVTWAPIEQWHLRTSFVHIGYLGLIHRLGFPTAMVLFVVLVLYTVRAFRVALRARRGLGPPLARAMAIGVFAYMVANYVVIFMAGIFDQRYGNIMFAFMFAAVAIAERHVIENEPTKEQPILK